MLKIYELELGEKGIIRSINCDEEMKERFASFGVVPGLVFEINQKYEDNNIIIGWDKARVSIIEMFGANILVDKAEVVSATPSDKRLIVLKAMDRVIEALIDNEPKEDWHMFIAENTKVINGRSSTLADNPRTYEEACKLFTNLISAYGKDGFNLGEKN